MISLHVPESTRVPETTIYMASNMMYPAAMLLIINLHVKTTDSFIIVLQKYVN